MCGKSFSFHVSVYVYFGKTEIYIIMGFIEKEMNNMSDEKLGKVVDTHAAID